MSHAQQGRKSPAHWSPLARAASEAVDAYKHDGKSGAVAMGPRVGKSAKLLCNELNEDFPGAKLGLTTAFFIDNELPRPAILYKYAEMLYHVCFPLPDPTVPCGDVELLTKFSEWQAAMGKTCQAIHEALADGRITEFESQTILSAGYAHMQKFMEFIQRIKELAE